MKLILASQSPRRRELLARLGTWNFPSLPRMWMKPCSRGVRLRLKWRACRRTRQRPPRHGPGMRRSLWRRTRLWCWTAGCWGKPRDPDDAVRMLTALSGRVHQVMTGVTVRRAGAVQTDTVVTDVQFRTLSAAEIRAYAATGEPLDKRRLRSRGWRRCLVEPAGRRLLQCGGPAAVQAVPDAAVCRRDGVGPAGRSGTGTLS